MNRVVRVYSDATDKLVDEVDIEISDLERFRAEFEVLNESDPMVECYPIRKENIKFIGAYLKSELSWDFENYSYFVETDTT